eukprot:CAMPEP_0195511678 /NCGR_PEP_ID=MMETSP0794_2-20130614/3917_1 /TAXON_ID=515487 /ORGANISM="Stephanopyxis turris, Strain CCMP 815" /LENGTH=388 /DNA_ID=CAMNT_0040639329 /DNA_START=149 /DNA_END=1312 /DNA_ORIENTATION=+
MFFSRPLLLLVAVSLNEVSLAIDPWNKQISVSPLSRSLLSTSRRSADCSGGVINNKLCSSPLLSGGGDVESVSPSGEISTTEVSDANEEAVEQQDINEAEQPKEEELEDGEAPAVTDNDSPAQSSLENLFGEGFGGHCVDSTAKKYAKKLKNRNNLNIQRKVTHCMFGLFFAGLNTIIPRKTFVTGTAGITAFSLTVELLRYRRGFGWMNNAMHFFLGNTLRKHEMEGKFTGSFYFFFGVTLTAYAFPKSAATLGICQLALADPSASFFGARTRHVYWSRIEGGLGGLGRNKGILGFLGGALFCFPFNYRMLSIAKWGAEGIPGGRQSLILASLSLGLAGALADLAVPTPAVCMPKTVLGVPVPPFHIDDNFVVPILSGYACTKIFTW